MAPDDRAPIISRVASALDRIQQANLLRIFCAQQLVARGADTMALRVFSSCIHEDTLIERRDSRIDVASDLGHRAAELSKLALRRGYGRMVIGTRRRFATWDAVLDSWPIVSGCIYGDPRWEDGSAITMYGVVSADKRTLIGMSMDDDLGCKAELAP